MIIRTKYEDIKDKKYDAIVIGSGMGGMTTAAMLAKCGQKVCVVEQHYLIGGMTHTFSRQGFTWDVGVHALGEMDEKRLPGKVMKLISNGKVKMNQYGDGEDKVYDTFNFPDISFGLPSSYKRFKEKLVELFPKEEKNIDFYFQLVYDISQKAKKYYMYKTLPKWMNAFLSKFTLGEFNKYAFKTTSEVLNEIFDDKKLIGIIAGQWGYYGTSPSKAAFFIQCMVTRHFWNGAYYPVGNSSVIAKEVVDVVQQAGGDFLCRSMVKKIIKENNKAVGVEIDGGNKLYAEKIISAISAKKSWQEFLPEYKEGEEVKNFEMTPCHVCLYIGLEGDIKETEASESNQWLYEHWDLDDMTWHADDLNSQAPCLYISFPSLKDPNHEGDKHTAEVVTFIPWEVVKKWKDTTVRKRGDEYTTLKESMKERIVEQMNKHYPKLMEKVTFMEFSTPLSTVHYCNTPEGAIYGLEATPRRFKSQALNPQTPLKNFYLTGGDVATLGVVGAMMGGMMTAATIDKKVMTQLQ